MTNQRVFQAPPLSTSGDTVQTTCSPSEHCGSCGASSPLFTLPASLPPCGVADREVYLKRNLALPTPWLHVGPTDDCEWRCTGVRSTQSPTPTSTSPRRLFTRSWRTRSGLYRRGRGRTSLPSRLRTLLAMPAVVHTCHAASCVCVFCHSLVGPVSFLTGLPRHCRTGNTAVLADW